MLLSLIHVWNAVGLIQKGVEFLISDYGEKAEDAVDYEDIQEEYDGPEVQLAPQEMQFYARAALAGPPKKVDEEDDYDEEEDSDSAEQHIESKPESPVKIVTRMISTFL